jgi:hypothetical protein
MRKKNSHRREKDARSTCNARSLRENLTKDKENENRKIYSKKYELVSTYYKPIQENFPAPL